MKQALQVLGSSAVVFAVAFFLMAPKTATSPLPVQSVRRVTSDAAVAAQKFLASLTPEQRSRVALPYNDPTKAHWHNLPPNMAPRPGIAFRDLSPTQRELGFKLLKVILSPYGYDKITSITSADEFLGANMGIGFPTGPNAYLLAIFGTPSASEPWAIQYGGHHLGLNVAMDGGNHVMAPTLTGAYPNIYTKDGKKIFVLHDEVDRALKLVNSLSPAEREQAVASTQIWDFILGPGHDGQMVQPEGLKGSEMTADQKAMMIDLAAAWVDVMNEESAKAKLADIQQNLDNTYFLWSGGTTERGNAYFRIQGPTVWIEYSPQTLGGPGSVGFRPAGNRGPGGGGGPGRQGPPAGGWPPPALDMSQFQNDPNRKLDPSHVHAVYRDFTGDYGVGRSGKSR